MATKSGTNRKPNPAIRTRRSVRELMKHPVELNDFLKAWKAIKELDVCDPRSFWVIAGYHGEPFDKSPANEDPNGKEKYWGGYCQHANVLFPTWHRCFVMSLENALNDVLPYRKTPIAMPYWDGTSIESLQHGIPDLLTAETVIIDGVKSPNPLINYVLQKPICPEEADENYAKPKGYTTVRYPFSGIMSPKSQQEITLEHNEEMSNTIEAADSTAAIYLNANITKWMTSGNPSKPHPKSIYEKYSDCLENMHYNNFSNTSSLNGTLKKSLESPHNDVHLAIGGYSLNNTDTGLVPGANGDMGENETAAFDPIFFFHHCNVDRMFWIWQKMHGYTGNIIINPNDKEGTNPSSPEGQGPTPGQWPNEQLTTDTKLYPFTRSILPNTIDDETMMTSKLCINIESLGYQYSPGSFDVTLPMKLEQTNQFESYAIREFTGEQKKSDEIHFLSHGADTIRKLRGDSKVICLPGCKLEVMKIDRNIHPGSFVVEAYHKGTLVGQESVLNRFNRKTCANCQLHNYITIVFDLLGEGLPDVMRSSDIKLYTYGRKISDISQKERIELKTEVKLYEAFQLQN